MTWDVPTWIIVTSVWEKRRWRGGIRAGPLVSHCYVYKSKLFMFFIGCLQGAQPVYFFVYHDKQCNNFSHEYCIFIWYYIRPSAVIPNNSAVLNVAMLIAYTIILHFPAYPWFMSVLFYENNVFTSPSFFNCAFKWRSSRNYIFIQFLSSVGSRNSSNGYKVVL